MSALAKPLANPIKQIITGKERAEETRPEEYVDKDEEEARQDPRSPARWWFASTFFPLIAGTFGPLATAFNICALVMDWRVIVDPASTESLGVNIPDPDWLDGVNAVALFTSVMANLMLLAHSTGRIRFAIAQPAIVTFFYLTSFILIGLVSAAPAHLQLPAGEDRTWSQGYWYAILAAILTFILGTMMGFTALGVYIGEYSRGFKLGSTQQTLMFQTTTFIGYILAAAAVYSRVEGWEYLDGVYFVDVTLLTIGYGDITPKTHLGQSLLFPMAVGGILFLGLIIASISTLVLEGTTTKISVRSLEKARQNALRKGNPSSGIVHIRPGIKHDLGKGVSSELDRREQEFNIMREVQKKAATNNRFVALIVSVGMTCGLWFIGAAVFQQAELESQGWTYFESLYFTYVSLLTIGYGDYYVQTNSGKPAFVLWSLIALPTLTVLIGSIGGLINEGVGALTLWIAEHLPETSGALRGLKHEASKKKKGDGGAHGEVKPAGFMAPDSGDIEKDPRSENEGTSKGHDDLRNVDKVGKHHHRYLLMRQIKSVVDQVDATPPRRYTYSEWTWILKLLGEDESQPDTHRSPHDSHVAETTGNTQDTTWSWLGQNSPLMSGMDEPKWVLQRLMDALERDLKEEGELSSEQEHHDGLRSIEGDVAPS